MSLAGDQPTVYEPLFSAKLIIRQSMYYSALAQIDIMRSVNLFSFKLCHIFSLHKSYIIHQKLFLLNLRDFNIKIVGKSELFRIKQERWMKSEPFVSRFKST